MPKKRIIDPKFFKDSKMAKLDYKTRLFYVGLWTLVDDYGVGEYDLEQIRVDIFPYVRSSVKKLWDKLLTIKRVELFKIDDKEYFWIPKFLEYQWLSHPTEQFPQTPEISSKIQKILANRKEKKGIEKKGKEENTSSSKKPYYKGEQMRFSQNKWWVVPKEGGEWLEFAGKESEIEYK